MLNSRHLRKPNRIWGFWTAYQDVTTFLGWCQLIPSNLLKRKCSYGWNGHFPSWSARVRPASTPWVAITIRAPSETNNSTVPAPFHSCRRWRLRLCLPVFLSFGAYFVMVFLVCKMQNLKALAQVILDYFLGNLTQTNRFAFLKFGISFNNSAIQKLITWVW